MAPKDKNTRRDDLTRQPFHFEEAAQSQPRITAAVNSIHTTHAIEMQVRQVKYNNHL